MSSFTMFLTLITIFLINSKTQALTSDGLSLLALKAAIDSDPTGILRHWSDTDDTPCRWPGVVCTRGRVTDLYLPNKGFTGYIPSELGRLDSLKRLSLSHNNLSNPIPAHLFRALSLVALDLSGNSLSGPIPAQIGDPNSSLRHLDLSSNRLNGSLPRTLSDLRSLIGTLNLSFNQLSGAIPPEFGRIPVFVSLDLRHNNLSGKIPQVGSLLNQGPTAFAGNPSLCGFPLDTQCAQEAHHSSNDVVVDIPQKPLISNPNGFPREEGEKTVSMAVPVISAVSVVAVVGAVAVSVWALRRKWKGSGEGKVVNKGEGFDGGKVIVDDEEGQKGKFVVVDEGFGLELEDLLRASAYVVGKSRSGIVYRVVAGGGKGSAAVSTTVAVRRLSEGDAAWRFKDFEAEMEAIGRVQHPNIVRLRAYYYASDEKLLVTDFVRNGSLYSALHGEPSNPAPALSWSTRLKIAQGTARGLTYLHEYSPRKYAHGSLKSSKILLDDDLQPYVSGFGMTRLVPGSSKFTSSASKKSSSSSIVTASGLKASSAPSNAHLAPEVRIPGSKLTQKCDVYSFGVVLLEILTGKLPNEGPDNDGKGLEGLVRKAFREEWPLSEVIDPALLTEVHAKKQVVQAFHIALNCMELDPEIRPRMKTVSESLDRIRMQ